MRTNRHCGEGRRTSVVGTVRRACRRVRRVPAKREIEEIQQIADASAIKTGPDAIAEPAQSGPAWESRPGAPTEA